MTHRCNALPNGELTPLLKLRPIALAVWSRSIVKPDGSASNPAARRRMIHVAVGPITPSQNCST